jgi:hypothetical protein
MEPIKNAILFWEKLYSAKEATVKFVKQDGTIRIMKCTLDFTQIPKDKQPKKVDMPKILKLMKESGIIHVFDLEKKDWRSVPFNKIDWLEIVPKDSPKEKIRYKITPFK